MTSSKVFVAPEDGWFQFIGIAKSGRGGVAGGTQTEGKLVVEVEELEELLPAYLLLKKEKM